ncbi:unnamed protein product [Parascedosporium putredinis]|uniref:Extradiol ring-cleavage dioxygenase class III enzyme subunit B domain-containing protein n=1 Tax=Parascedosporium putredinis TaxID=1442378 RepID=A0A9P1M8F5_9PEZI|nr:unnamed protein product [Parascedosporium putredinis]CAI7993476.1 unnamed protein product [Parascedosporium putredinis]
MSQNATLMSDDATEDTTEIMSNGCTPVYFFSHGSTMMLGEESESADYWKKAGDEALAHKIKGVIMMHRGRHAPRPRQVPVAYVHPSKYVDYKLNPDLKTAERCISMLRDAGFDAAGNPTFDWIHDTFLVLIRMFPNGCPHHPHLHEQPLRPPLPHEGAAPDFWALEFRQAVEDVVRNNSGPALRRAMTRLMKHPMYRDAHATDDHFMAAMFVAGLAGDEEDEGVHGELRAETWELTNMCNSQFSFGAWPRTLATAG